MGKNHNPAEKRYSCDTCDREFGTIVAKRKHYRTEHQKKDAYLCHVCDLVFVDRHRLNMHVKSVHLKLKDIQGRRSPN
jgi:DNA-directed RNA polymerase subunit RPC12/RpoP